MRKITIATLTAMAALTTISAAQPTFTNLYSFTATSDGTRPNPPVIGPDGVLYGTTVGGNNVYAVTPPSSPGGAWTETTLYNFLGGSSDGTSPNGSLIRATGPHGELVFYGATLGGGPNSAGTIYSLTAPSSPGGAWTEQVLHSFAGKSAGSQDGASPQALIMGTDGVLYGVTLNGGSGACRNNGIGGCGTLFSLAPPASPGGAWTETVLYSFQPESEGPSSLVMGAGGVIYGTSALAGEESTACGFGRNTICGLVFSLTPPSSPDGDWTYATIFSFDGTTGFSPNGLTVDSNGVLYGASFNNVYSLTPPAVAGGDWTQAVLAKFKVPRESGESPFGITLGGGGVLYGATYLGGKYFGGSLFKITPPATPSGAWTLKTLYSVNTANQGAFITGFVIAPGAHPVWYGATMGGEIPENMWGTIFEFQP